MNLEEQVMDNLATALKNEIDFQILSDMLVELGWIRVVLKPMTWEEGVVVDDWVSNNIHGNFETMGLVWVFENSKEANWFALKWL